MHFFMARGKKKLFFMTRGKKSLATIELDNHNR
jgi:hypothetical protein